MSNNNLQDLEPQAIKILMILSLMEKQVVQHTTESSASVPDVPGHPWQMVETSSWTTHFFKKDMGPSGVREGSILTMRIAGLQDVDILARCKGRKQSPCQGTGFPGKGWLGWTWGFHAPFLLTPQRPLNDLDSRHYSTTYEPKGHFIGCNSWGYVGPSPFETCLEHPHEAMTSYCKMKQCRG